MKKYIFLTIFIQINILSFGQGNYIPHSACSNYNTFLTSPNLHLLEAVVDTVMPDGTIYFDPEMLNVTGEPNEIYSLLGLNSNTTFQYISESKSFFDQDIIYVKYKQLFRGLEVEGGGYTAAMVINGNTGGPGGPGGPDNPCLNVFMLAPYILNNINIPIVPTVSEDQIYGILPYQKINSIELIVSHNIANNCNYNLVWRVNCNENTEAEGNVNVNYWVDALDGSILKREETNMAINIEAPTETYGNKIFNNYKDNEGYTYLLSEGTTNGRVTCYYYKTGSLGLGLDQSKIPKTLNNKWTNEASKNAYQTYYVVDKVVNLFENININFGRVRAVWEDGAIGGTEAWSGSTMALALIRFTDYGGCTALYDVAGHELGHVYIKSLGLEYDEIGNKSITEGMSDIIGTYVEHIQQGYFDWIIADDEPNVANQVDRDLQNPKNDCISNSLGFYERGEVLGYWYYLVTQGNSSLNITPIDKLQTLNILTEAIKRIGPKADFIDLMNQTLHICSEFYGRCSSQFESCQHAWETICVSTNGYEDPYLCMSNPGVQICEENDYLQLYVNGGLPSSIYRWKIIGRQSTEFYAFGAPLNSNTYYGGQYLNLTKFPNFDFYPQLITIEVSAFPTGGAFTARRLIKFYDCDNSGPTCEEFYDVNPILTSTNENVEPFFDLNNDSFIFEVFDILGNKVYSGDEESFKNYRKGFYILIKRNNKGKIMSIEKSFRL